MREWHHPRVPQYRIVDEKQAVQAEAEHTRDDGAEQWFTGWVLSGGPSRGAKPHRLERHDSTGWQLVASWAQAD